MTLLSIRNDGPQRDALDSIEERPIAGRILKGVDPRRPQKLRILVLAEWCNPRWTSGPLVAYSLARALAERGDLDITLVSQVRNREALEADPIADRVPIHYIDTEFVGRPFHRLSEFIRRGSGLSWTTGAAAAYPSLIAFEWMAYRRFAAELRAGSFDLIHRLSPLTPTVGSPIASLSDVPTLIGPLNGGLPWPSEHPGLRRKEREWLSKVRGMYRWLPYYRSTYRHARGVIAGSWHTASEVPSWYRGRRYYIPENGFDPGRIPLATGWVPPEPGKRFRFATIGRLVPYKGFDLILQAMARSETLRRDAELLIIGDGPSRAGLEAMASELGLESNVSFAGWVEHTQVHQQLRSAQALAFPSLREFGGGVLVEAMASGLPSVVVNYGGPGEIVTDQCGIRLPMMPREPLIGQLSEAMATLVGDRDLCRSMSARAIDRVREGFTWAKKGEQIAAIYRDLLGLSSDHFRTRSPGQRPSRYMCPTALVESPV